MAYRINLRYLLTAGLILLLVAILWRPAAESATLTGGNTTYVVDGEERTFTFDPISRKDGQLVHSVVFEGLGVKVVEDGKTAQLTRGEQQATLTLGIPIAAVGDRLVPMVPAPVRLNGRLFLPLAVLAEFGFDIVSDSNYLQFRDLAAGLRLESDLSAAAWNAMKDRLSLRSQIKSDDGRSFVEIEITHLVAELIASDHFAATYRQRVDLLNLLKTNNLLLVKIFHNTGRSATVSPTSLALVDLGPGIQYDVEQALPYQGLISQKVATGAFKTSVLVLPKLPEGVSSMNVFADTNPGTIGNLTLR